ncbi:MAG: CDP-alcohol phosphatidyltransferase family protein [Propionibacteriaceae bacterium]|jgi:phosphatidylglycerophosphate synthase|nr:CDP-alcohol phosphatidyltransferase family protein [Propionibacteriaceae bacterium]
MKKAEVAGFRRYIPNIFSITRIAGVLALPLLMWPSWKWPLGEYSVPWVWIGFFLFLMATDKLDGTLARKLNAESELGALLDTIGDALMLLVGVFCALFSLARASLSDTLFWLCVVIVGIILAEKVIAYFVTLKWHGEGNTLHSWPNKIFTTVCCVFILGWAFTGIMPLWSVLVALAMMTYAVIDEVIYTVRTNEYDVDFKGHGLQKYTRREDLAVASAD